MPFMVDGMHRRRRGSGPFVLVAVVAIAFGCWLLIGDGDAPPLMPIPGDATNMAAAAAEHGLGVVAADAVPASRREFACRILVRDTQQRPVVGCAVSIWRDGDETVLHGTTAADGGASFAGCAGAGGWVVEPPGLAALAATCAELDGEHEVLLATGARVTGVVLVDGEPAPAGLLLGLSSPLQLVDGAPQALKKKWAYVPPRLLETDAAGRFVFDGLRPDWRGGLMMASSHWLLPDETAAKEWRPRYLELERPQQDLVLRTTALPTVRGRVVWDDSGEPVTSGYVGLDAKCSGERHATGSAAIGPGGRFAVGLEPGLHDYRGWLVAAARPSLQSADVVVQAVPGGVPLSVTIADAALATELELRVQRAPTTFFLAIDEQGTPLAGAQVDVEDSSRTGADGRGWFRGTDVRYIGAEGRVVLPVVAQRGSGTEADPLVYVLPPANRLTVIVVPPAGSTARGLQVLLAGAQPMSAGGKGRSPLHDRFGQRLQEGGITRTRAEGGTEKIKTLSVILGSDGRAEFHSLVPDFACQLVVVDAVENELARTEIVLPPYGRRIEQRVEVGSSARRIRGRVTDERGQPLPNANVSLWHRAGADMRTMRPKVRADGSFESLGLHSSGSFDLLVRAAGFAPAFRRGLTADRDGEFHEIRLLPGRAVTVRVVDRDGQPAEVFAQPEGFEFEHEIQQRVGPGALRWGNLPARVVFVAVLNGERHELPHDTSVPEAVLTVPSTGRVWAASALLPAGEHGWSWAIELRRLDGRGQPVLVRFEQEAESSTPVLPGNYATVLMRAQRDPIGAQQWMAVRSGPVVEVKVGELLPLPMP